MNSHHPDHTKPGKANQFIRYQPSLYLIFSAFNSPFLAYIIWPSFELLIHFSHEDLYIN